jgi:hypothetical protein
MSVGQMSVGQTFIMWPKDVDVMEH